MTHSKAASRNALQRIPLRRIADVSQSVMADKSVTDKANKQGWGSTVNAAANQIKLIDTVGDRHSLPSVTKLPMG